MSAQFPKKHLILSLVLILSFALASCGTQPSSQVGNKTDPIKVGVIAPLTGSQASIGTAVVKGINLAAKKINESGGINGRQLEMVTLDDRNTPDEAVSAARRLISESNVNVILGSVGSSSTLAIQQLTMQQGVLLITPVSLAPKLSQVGDKFFFRVSATASNREASFTKFITEKLNVKTIAFLSSNEDLGRATVEAATKGYEAAGHPKVIYTGFYDPSATSFTTELNKIKALNPDALYIVADSVKAATIVKQARLLDMHPILLASGEAATQEFVRLAEGAGEGIYVPLDWSVSFDDPKSVEFLKAYKEEYNSLPETKFAVQGWEATWILAEAMHRTANNLTATTISDEMRKTNWLGPRGLWTFNDAGDPVITTYVSKLAGSSFVIAK